MADKGLKSLSRGELLELLIAQMEENEKLHKRLAEVEEELQERRINIQKAGTMAEASLLLNGVFQAADEAANQYLENIRLLSEGQTSRILRIEEEAQAKADTIILVAKRRAEAIVKAAETQSQMIQMEKEDKIT